MTDDKRAGAPDAGPTSRLRAMVVADDALAPLLRQGQAVVVDWDDQELRTGGVYAFRDGKDLTLRLYLGGDDAFGGRSGGTLVALSGDAELLGPVAVDSVAVIGRVVEPLTARPPALADLGEQRRRLTSLRQKIAAALLQRLERPAAGSAPISFGQAAEALPSEFDVPGAAQRLALERRLDAIDARLALLEALIAEAPADDLDDALVKLETLAALDLEGSDTLEARLLRSAMEAMQRIVAGSGRLA